MYSTCSRKAAFIKQINIDALGNCIRAQGISAGHFVPDSAAIRSRFMNLVP